MELKRVVVTGMGALTPIGNTLQEYEQGLFSGRSGAAGITQFDTTQFKTKFACEVKGFDPLAFMDKKEVKRHDLFSQYALACSGEALLDSGLNEYAALNRNKVGVIWSAGIGGIKVFQDEMESFFSTEERIPRFNPFFIPRMILDIAAGHISMKHGYHGLNFAVVSACASSTNALIDALTYLRLGRADAIVVGGSESAITEGGIGGFNALKALSERNDSPETASRPFDLDRDGFVMGEGAGCMILETLEHAQHRGAKIYAELIGGGFSADAYHLTAPHPDGLGASLVMQDVLQDAGVKPEDIDYINVHGTSTPLGDVSEVKAIQEVFGAHAYRLNISSTKSMTGHLLGAAGIVEAVASVLAIQRQEVPPTINHFTDDPQFDPGLNFTFNQSQKREVRKVLSNTFGFGGHNASVIFTHWEG
jgi:3-oxoacyl-[acyl-carrier-protein] synthase II